MSQEAVRQLLIEEGGEATIDELRQLAKEHYPDRTLYKYLQDRLQSLSKKGFVIKTDDSDTVWKLTEKGQNTKTGDLSVRELEDDKSIKKLDQYNIKISNIVAGFELDGNLDLGQISKNHANADYHPESNNRLYYSPSKDESIKLVAPSSGRISIVGAEGIDDLKEARTEFLQLVEVEYLPEIVIQNIVGATSLDRELNLMALATSEEDLFEYSPENFPGLVFRSHNGATILIFTSGKCVITGAKTYRQIVESYEELIRLLRNIGVNNIGEPE